ncbi:MAG: Fic family protein [Dongiaceae bacterium]
MLFTAPALPEQYENVVGRIDELRQKLRHQLLNHPKRWMGVLRRQTFARAIQGSNSIEGYMVTREDAVAAIENEPPLDANDEAWMAVSGYRAAMSYILQLADDPHYVHNEGTIRSLHYMMLGYDLAKHPGRWRPGTIYVRREPTGEIVYEGPDIDLVPGLMQDLIDSMNAPSNMPSVVRAAMTHLNLVMIHPFSDGNGRMARALQTMVLSRDGILDSRFSSIEEYLGGNTLEYYAVLADVGQGSWHPERDPLRWIRFCLTAHYRQAESLLRRSKELEKFWGEIEIQLKRRSLNERMALALVDAGFGFGVRNATYRAAVEVSIEVAGKDLRALVKADMLVPKGEKRGRVYVASDWLKEVRKLTREARYITDPFSGEVKASVPKEQRYLPGLEPI